MVATENSLKNIDPEKEFNLRYQYIKLTRVQLSNTEQTMIYFNSFFGPGFVWWEDPKFLNPWGDPLSYFLDYAVIKNIPLNQIREDKLGPDPENEFSRQIKIRELKNRKIHFSIYDLFEQIGG